MESSDSAGGKSCEKIVFLYSSPFSSDILPLLIVNMVYASIYLRILCTVSSVSESSLFQSFCFIALFEDIPSDTSKIVDCTTDCSSTGRRCATS